MPDPTAEQPNEFDIIRRYFRPLSLGTAGGLGLSDDAALLPIDDQGDLVVTTDTLIAGVHFLPDCNPGAIAAKALAVNLSDLAAMAAKPCWYSLALALPGDWSEPWIAAFCSGLSAVQARYDITLIGGDTTRTPGPLTITITAMGRANPSEAVTRGGAGAGDIIFVSGVIGDAYLGLQSRLGALPSDQATWIEAYEQPVPRVALGQALSPVVTAMADISDGLLADIGHIAAASNLAAVVEIDRVPLSAPTKDWVSEGPDRLNRLLTAGDDYELVFTAPEASQAQIDSVAEAQNLAIRAIGRMEPGHGVSTQSPDGRIFPLTERGGYRHF